ncbi:hypothetical protein SEPCBS57363_004207 [Sporothrix epigloea]|uniref:Sialidase n=1 Tax=Sporothrix epigloea TaxID=1892477 RepID=A0ABP0DQS7_9PEZI
MSSSLAADVAFDFCFSPYNPATPPPPVNSHSGCSHFMPMPPDAYLSTPAVSAPSTRHSTPTRSPIRKLGPLLLPKIRSQDQALGGLTNADADTAVSKPKRSRVSPPTTAERSRSKAAAKRHRRTLITPSQPYAVSSGAVLSRHISSFSDLDSIATANDSQQQRGATPMTVFETTPPPPEPHYFSAKFEPLQSQPPSSKQPQKQQQQQQEQQHGSFFDRAEATCSLNGTGHLDDCGLFMHDTYDYDYSFAPYPGTVPTNYLASVEPSSQYGDATFGQIHLPPQPHQQHTQGDRILLPLRPASPQRTALLEQDFPSKSASFVADTPLLATAAPAAATSASSLVAYLTGTNPAPALVRTISFPLADLSTKHYWWDVRQVRPWYSFNMANLAALPGASLVLSCPVPMAFLPTPQLPARSIQPETESELHDLCSAHYLPRVNAALCLSSPRPIQLTCSSTSQDFGRFFVGHATGDSAITAALFGGGPMARVIGLVKSFDRFNTGMRSEGNVRRVEYLRGLAHLHYLMREHSCRYGFLLTEIELVLVRNGTEPIPFFGQLEVTSVSLAITSAEPLAKVTANRVSDSQFADDALDNMPLTACLALWGLCMLASDEMAAAAATSSDNDLLCPHTTHIGAPAEGTRQKAAPRDDWMPQPQLVEKRAAKRARGWILPEDAVCRKEMGRRGVRYISVR